MRRIRQRKEFHVSHKKQGCKVFIWLVFIEICLFGWVNHLTIVQRPAANIQQFINESAAKEDISPLFIEAVILTESKFDEKARSHVGAVGMMQLMPETAAWISEQSGILSDHLEEPKENISLGAWYLNFLLKKYHNNEVLALAAYNAGRGHVDGWIEDYGWKEDFSRIDEIPFPETREFVRSVVTARDRLEEEEKHE